MPINYANKGKGLEDLIEAANSYYDKAGIAIITKNATPTKVIRAFNQNSGRSEIVKAFHEKKSTVDFSGIIVGGIPVAFDAKQTMNKTTFRLGLIEPHQADYLAKFRELGGRAFLIVEFTMTKEIYRVDIATIMKYAEKGAKSVRLSEIRNDCQACSQSGTNPLHYLENLK